MKLKKGGFEMKHIKKIIVAFVFLLLVSLIVPTYPQTSKHIGGGKSNDNGTVTIQSDMPEKD